MSSEPCEHNPTRLIPIYTVYPDGNQWNLNSEFYQNNYREPPPKYEDIISGNAHSMPSQQPLRSFEATEPSSVIVVATPSKYAKRILGIIFTILIIIIFVFIFIIS